MDMYVSRSRCCSLEDVTCWEPVVEEPSMSLSCSLFFPSSHSCEDVLTPLPSLPTESPSMAGQTPHPHGPSLLLQLELLSNEKQSMEAELQRCQGAEQEAKERVRRLDGAVAMTTCINQSVSGGGEVY